MLKPATTIATILAALLPAIGYALGGRWVGAVASVALGGLWLAAQQRGWNGVEALGLVGFVSLAAVGVLLGLAAPMLLVGVVVALVAWDLDRFARRLRSAGHVEAERALVRAHLQRVLLAVGLGLLLSLVAGGIQIPLSFGWIVGLAVLAVLGLSRAVRALNREGE